MPNQCRVSTACEPARREDAAATLHVDHHPPPRSAWRSAISARKDGRACHTRPSSPRENQLAHAKTRGRSQLRLRGGEFVSRRADECLASRSLASLSHNTAYRRRAGQRHLKCCAGGVRCSPDQHPARGHLTPLADERDGKLARPLSAFSGDRSHRHKRAPSHAPKPESGRERANPAPCADAYSALATAIPR